MQEIDKLIKLLDAENLYYERFCSNVKMAYGYNRRKQLIVTDGKTTISCTSFYCDYETLEKGLIEICDFNSAPIINLTAEETFKIIKEKLGGNENE